ncbi:hypothetical protein [Nonomuraea dietziae]|uniref:hypothetical protein n=1 Tax=Nonomuraea dietziae TaxID=65515 RepID=UPI0031DF80A6
MDLLRLRRHNALVVIGVPRGEQPLTLTDVAGRTSLSRASAEDVVRELMGKGWVAEAAPVAGGRRQTGARLQVQGRRGAGSWVSTLVVTRCSRSSPTSTGACSAGSGSPSRRRWAGPSAWPP